MARVKFGSLVTDMRGKLGGHVFQKGNHSAVLKNASIPKQNFSPSRRLAESELRRVKQIWNGLSIDQKEEWGEYAKNFKFKNVFKDEIIPTARQIFMKYGMTLALGGFIPNPTPPSLNNFVNPSQLLSASLNTTSESISLTFETPVGLIFNIITAARVVGTSPNINKLKFIYMGSFQYPGGSEEKVYNTLTAQYPDLQTTDVVYIKAIGINLSGIRGDRGIVQLTIT